MGLRNKLKVWMLRKVVNDQTLYDIVSAIRGCDSTNIFLKSLFTARIRYLAGLDSGRADVDVREYKKVRLRMIYLAITSVSVADIHCLEHVMLAVDALERLKLIDKEEADVLSTIASVLACVAKGAIDRDTAGKKIKELAKKYENLIKP